MTRITELDDGVGTEVEAVTLLTYYDDTDPNKSYCQKSLMAHDQAA